MYMLPIIKNREKLKHAKSELWLMQRAAENRNMSFDSHMIHERKCPSIDFHPKQQRITKNSNQNTHTWSRHESGFCHSKLNYSPYQTGASMFKEVFYL